MITLTWYGHSTISLQSGGKTILIDPFFTDNPAASITADEATADYILITHGHHDHLGDTVPISKRCNVRAISNVEISRWLSAQGVQAQGVEFGQNVTFPFGSLQLTPAIHGTGLPDGSDGGKPGGFLLTMEGKNIYIAGDTTLFDDMKTIGAHGLDLAVLPIGGFYTMDPDQALQAVKLLAPRMVIPYHFSTWDKIAQDPRAWAVRVEAETTAKVHVLNPGGTLTL